MTVLFTRKDYDRLPEGMPVQLLDGLLVKQPSPLWGHQRIQSRILAALGNQAARSRVIEDFELVPDRLFAAP